MNYSYQQLGKILVIIIVLISGCKEREKLERRPNIILIMADDLGYETISANGGESYNTPNIDQLASEGIRFEHCYAQPLCTPSRVKLMTGINNVRNYIGFGKLDTSQVTFGHLFKDAGYATAVVGKWQLGKDPSSPQKAGFDQHCLWQLTTGRIDSTGRDTRFSQPVLETKSGVKTYAKTEFGPEVVSQFGLDFIKKSVREERPFLLYYPMILTHCPFSPTPDSPDWMHNDTSVMKYKGHERYFQDMVSYTDKIIGQMNKAMSELGIEDNTVIIFCGDNGTDRPIKSQFDGAEVLGAKGTSTDAGTRVPLIVKWPNKIIPNQVSTDLVDFSDFLPTICESSDINVPDSLQIDGQSFLPQMVGEKGQPREYIYNWFSRSGDVDKARVFARNQRFKLYESGEFYEVPEDYLEENPLNIDELDKETAEVYEMLKTVLNSNKSRRLDAIPI